MFVCFYIIPLKFDWPTWNTCPDDCRHLARHFASTFWLIYLIVFCLVKPETTLNFITTLLLSCPACKDPWRHCARWRPRPDWRKSGWRSTTCRSSDTWASWRRAALDRRRTWRWCSRRSSNRTWPTTSGHWWRFPGTSTPGRLLARKTSRHIVEFNKRRTSLLTLW